MTIILLTLATAAIHFNFFITDGPIRGLIYGLNALGYVGLLAALYLPLPGLDRFRPVARRALMGFAALTIVAYVAFGLLRHDWTVPLGPIDKLIELALIALLWREERAARR